MTSMATTAVFVTGGVDTHGHTHHAAVLDCIGRQLGDREFPTSPAGYRALLQWMSGHGVVARVGVEGTGTYGVGLARHLREAGVHVVEVDRPDRRARRAQGNPIHWMLTLQPGRRYRVGHRSCRRCATARWRQSEPSGWPAPAPSKLAPKPLTS